MERFRQGGIPDGFAGFLAALDTMVANGGEERLNNVVGQVIGRPPKSFRAYIEENKDKLRMKQDEQASTRVPRDIVTIL